MPNTVCLYAVETTSHNEKNYMKKIRAQKNEKKNAPMEPQISGADIWLS